jgi:hypothetical protein
MASDVVNISTLISRLNRESSISCGLEYLDIEPDFQRAYVCWSYRMKVRLIETILKKRIMNPITVVVNDDDPDYLQHDVVDGLHRISTISDFINNKFKLNYDDFLDEDYGSKYHNKYFSDLRADEKTEFRSYKLHINILDTSYHHDRNKLQEMWTILNKSSAPLNEYEFTKMIYGKFYNILSEYKNDIKKSGIFHNRADERGGYEITIHEMLVCSQKLPQKWSSVPQLCKDWRAEIIGKTEMDVNNYISKNEKQIREKLELMSYIANNLNNLYKHGKFNSRERVYNFMISRIMYHFINKPHFVKIKDKLIEDMLSIFKHEVMQSHRNGKFQKMVIDMIDDKLSILFRDYEPRIFPPNLVDRKIAEQDNKCNLCSKPLENDHHADHIIPWTSGGSTTYENLQVIHHRCHKQKC